MTRKQGLKPCPFCGVSLERSEVFSSRTSVYYFHPKSDDERCPAQDVLVHGPSSAAKWNSRAALPDDAVTMKPLDLSNLLKHAFLSGVVAARNIPGHDECIGPDLWVDYDPTANPAYDRILSAIDASPAPKVEAVTVKPLEWVDGEAKTSFGSSYTVHRRADSMYETVGYGAFVNGPHPDRVSAKDAAQAHYERRVLSAIDTSPTITDEAVERAARALDPEIWEIDAPVPTRAATEDFHARRSKSIETARTALTAAFPSRGETE